MSPIWGVDSWTPANHPMGGGQSLFQAVTSRAGRPPAFWGRYLNDYRYRLTARERDFLVQNNCRILLVYNGSRRQPLRGQGAHDAGVAASEDAIAKARAVNILSGVRIFADLENWPVDAAWFQGWCESMAASPYAGMGGFYGNAASNWSWVGNATRGSEAIMDQQTDRLLEELATTGRSGSKALNVHFWTTRPLLAEPGTPFPRREQLIPSTFRAARPPFSLASETVLWQYRMNVPIGAGATVDLDLSIERGLEDMWSGGGQRASS